LGREAFSISAAAKQENVLDVIQRSGAHVLWLDNNSDSKGVALRVPYESYREAPNNPVCDEECRDVGMLAKLQKFIDSHASGDIVVVLHQMGNHGPAYFKRYPKEFERFVPACQNNDLSQCSIAEINNAYDNAILYTDHFLSETIAFLKKNDARFATGMFYMSDHGESLGEDGVFLHGLPYFIAPRAQILVPAILWLGSRFSPAQRQAVTEKQGVPLSHDNLFDTLLGLLDIETAVYQPELDILHAARKPRR
jgi:lipid A ethanolaminephosphotransferase